MRVSHGLLNVVDGFCGVLKGFCIFPWVPSVLAKSDCQDWQELLEGPEDETTKNISDGFIGFRVQGSGFRVQGLGRV